MFISLCFSPYLGLCSNIWKIRKHIQINEINCVDFLHEIWIVWIKFSFAYMHYNLQQEVHTHRASWVVQLVKNLPAM